METKKISLGPKTMLYPAPVLIVGSYDKKEIPNIMAVSWGGICCSKPPCVSISLRAATYSHGNIMETKAFTISLPSEEYVKEADYAGTFSGKDENKFESLGLTAIKSEIVQAPYVKEFPLIIECKVIKINELGYHTQFIGEILDVKINSDCIDGDLKPDISKIMPIAYSPGISEYYGLGKKLGKSYTRGKTLKK